MLIIGSHTISHIFAARFQGSKTSATTPAHAMDVETATRLLSEMLLFLAQSGPTHLPLSRASTTVPVAATVVVPATKMPATVRAMQQEHVFMPNLVVCS